MRATEATDDFRVVPVSMRLYKRVAAEAVALVWLSVAGCSGSGQSTAAAPSPYTQAQGEPSQQSPPSTASDNSASKPAAPILPAWISVDSANRTVTLSLETSAEPAASSALINGFRAGQARIIVPLAWTIKWSWRNTDSAAAHSLVVMTQREKIPAEGGRSAFSNAMTRTPVEGLASGQTDQSTFQAEEAGWYWLLCGVPGHALNGEWIELRIDPEAKTVGYLEKGHS